MSALILPLRTDTSASLPPYSSPRSSWGNGEAGRQAKTPAEILGLRVDHGNVQSGREPKLKRSRDSLFATSTDGEKRLYASPKSSPNALRPLRSSSELDTIDGLKPRSSRPNTDVEAAVFSDALGIFDGLSASTYTQSHVSTSPPVSSIPTSRKSSLAELVGSETMRGSFSPESATVEMMMENLSGAKWQVSQS